MISDAVRLFAEEPDRYSPDPELPSRRPILERVGFQAICEVSVLLDPTGD